MCDTPGQKMYNRIEAQRPFRSKRGGLMDTVHAIFENGVFRPVQPVALPENCAVEFEPRVVKEDPGCASEELYEILNKRYKSGHSDTAARHNEHQP